MPQVTRDVTVNGKFKRKMADIPQGGHNPLDFAIAKQSQSTLGMVQEAIAHNQTLLAFQPVMRGAAAGQVGFYEGLIRVLDPTGRVIPAGDFMGRSKKPKQDAKLMFWPCVTASMCWRSIAVCACLSTCPHALSGTDHG